MRTALCEQLGIEFPIFAFTHCRDVVAGNGSMARRFSRSGGTTSTVRHPSPSSSAMW